jgi:hypothetical protein
MPVARHSGHDHEGPCAWIWLAMSSTRCWSRAAVSRRCARSAIGVAVGHTAVMPCTNQARSVLGVGARQRFRTGRTRPGEIGGLILTDATHGTMGFIAG